MLSGKPYTLQNLSARLRDGSMTSVQLVEQSLARIHDPKGQGGVTFTRVFDKRAMQDARDADARRAGGGVLSVIDGLPISVKDLFDIAGYPTTAGSLVLADAEPAAEDALVVKRLREAGAIIVGTTNMTEFAYSGLGLNPHYGTPLSPWDRQIGHIAGGSSSGAAVSVADAMVVAAVGTDTGGSVRIPAAFCGVVGYKPTARRIDMQGTLPLSKHLDSIGPIANSVMDCAWLASIMAGEPLTVPPAVSLEGLTLGVPDQLVLDGMDDVVSGAFAAACELLEQSGAQVVNLDLPELLEIATMNAAGGFTAAQAWAWHGDLLNTRQAQYDPRVAVRIRRGETLSSTYITDLERARRQWITRVQAKLASIDALIMPTVPVVPPALKPLEQDDDLYAKTNLLALRNPTVINFMDGCAVSLPCQGPGQAPVGFMIAGLGGQDQKILAIARAFEAVMQD
ncbi:MAG: amidase [Burkholderiaceae bacterium]|nr:amidase [Burkholderiaceae bacterium]MCD8516274.1 amidase [Burkholderiaceae bacterium]